MRFLKWLFLLKKTTLEQKSVNEIYEQIKIQFNQISRPLINKLDMVVINLKKLDKKDLFVSVVNIDLIISFIERERIKI